MQALDFLIPKINNDEQKFLLKLAKDSIEACVKTYSLPSVDKSKLSNVLQKDGACFVTLMINDKLRGCIGSVVPHKPLYLDVIDNAISASSKDPRFPKLSKNEFENLTISISILGDLFEIKYNTLEELFLFFEVLHQKIAKAYQVLLFCFDFYRNPRFDVFDCSVTKLPS